MGETVSEVVEEFGRASVVVEMGKGKKKRGNRGRERKRGREEMYG